MANARRGTIRTLLGALVCDQDQREARAIVHVRPGADAEVVSRAQFQDAVIRASGALAALGMQSRDVVVIAHADGLDALYAFWGALRLGAIPAMFPSLTEKLNAVSYRRQMAMLVRQCGARLILTSGERVTMLSEIAGCRTESFEVLRDSETPAPAPPAPAPQAIAFLQHSSGTTGLQKGVALSHQAVINQIASYSEALRLTQDDVIVSWLPLYHDMGLIAGFLLPLVTGIPLVLMSPFDWVRRPALLLQAIHAHGGTLCWLPNFAYNHCARRTLDRETQGLSLAGMRAFINCSEPVLDASQRAFLERFAALGVRPEQLAASYAMAENVFAVTQTPLGRAPRLDVVDRATHVSCGPPIAGVEVRVGRGLPERSVGEIQVRSHCMLTGYHNRPDLDAGLFDAGWFRTGDLGYMADGELYVVGRQKDLIISGGKNLHPHDIEAVVSAIPGVHPGRAVVFGVADEAEGTELIAVVAEVDVEDSAGRSAIARMIREALVREAGVVASYVRLVDASWLVKTSSGKIARSANRDKWLAERGSKPSSSSREDAGAKGGLG